MRPASVLLCVLSFTLPITACKDRGLESKALADEGDTPVAPSALSLTCSERSGDEPFLKLAVDGAAVKTLKVGGYDIIANGAQRADSAIGSSVFGVSVSPITNGPGGTNKISVALSDYSEEHGFEIFFSREAREAAVITTFWTSDGDGLRHVYGNSLKCVSP